MLGYDWPRLHAALNDLPAALLLVAVLFELTSLILRKPALRVVGFWTLVIGAIGGVLAVISGLQAEEHIAHGEAVHRVMETHEKLAPHHARHLRGRGDLANPARDPDGRSRASAGPRPLARSARGSCSRPRRTAGGWSSTTRPGSRRRCSKRKCTSAPRATIIMGAKARKARITTTMRRPPPRIPPPLRPGERRTRRTPPATRTRTRLAPRRTRTDGMRRLCCLAATVLLGCQPSSTRPPFPPVPEAASTEIRLSPGDATRLLAEALREDSIPPSGSSCTTRGWSRAGSTPRPATTSSIVPSGSNVVRVRAWADPTRPGSSKVTVETVYRPIADPSLPQRDLDRQVPRDHPVAIKVRATLQDLVKRYGGPPPPPAAAGQHAPGGE